YEAGRAQRQFDAVEPENRLVARTLERAWEDTLAAVRKAENDLRTQQARRPVTLTESELAWISSAGADVKAVVWAPTTSIPERNKRIGAVTSEAVLTTHDQKRVADLRTIGQGGAAAELSMPMTQKRQPHPHHQRRHRAAGAAPSRALRRQDNRACPGQTAPPH